MPALVRNNDQKIPGAGSSEPSLTESVRDVAHDIRTPLSSLLSCLNLVMSGEAGDLTADQRRFLGMARRNIDRLDRMVDGMLTAARWPADSIPTSRRKVDLGPVLKEAVRQHQVTADLRGLEIDDSGLPESFPAKVDQDLVVRMLDNVLGNAVKFTAPGGLVRVWLESRAENPRSLAGRLASHCGLATSRFNLIVQDNGPGLSNGVQNRVFEPFNRGPTATGTEAPGTGLGLSITRRLAKAHGGHVRLTSLPEQGTTVWINLPGDPATEHVQQTADRLAEALVQGSEHGVQPLVGVLDLRRRSGLPPLGRLNVEGFFGRESSNFASVLEPAPGLWTAAVLDPVNWSRRWTLFAARRGGGLEATRWEYLDCDPGEDQTAQGNFREQMETMVNPSAAGSNIG